MNGHSQPIVGITKTDAPNDNGRIRKNTKVFILDDNTYVRGIKNLKLNIVSKNLFLLFKKLNKNYFFSWQIYE